MRVIKVFAAGFLCIITIGCSRPDDLDLSETYFPFGMDYEWTYQYHYYGWSDGETWDIYDTFSIRVIDSLYGDAGWLFLLQGSFMGLNSPITIEGDSIAVFGEMVSLLPEANGSEGWYELGINYSGDTLNLTYRIEPYSNSCHTRTSTRVIGLGAIKEYDSYWESEYYDDAIVHTLLYFCIGDDTVWRKN